MFNNLFNLYRKQSPLRYNFDHFHICIDPKQNCTNISGQKSVTVL